MKKRREPAILPGQQGVARAHGEPVGLAHRRAGDDFGVDEECARHVANQLELLPVLFAEVRPLRSDDIEQLEDHRQHPVEVAVAVGAFELAAHRRLRHLEPVAVGVDLVGVGRHDQVHTRPLAGRHVGFEGPRVAHEVVGIVVLGRVDEDRDRNPIVVAPCPFHQAQVAGMEGPHGGYEPEARSAVANRTTPISRRVNSRDDFHHR